MYQAEVTEMEEKAETTESTGVPTYIEDVTITMSVILKRDISGKAKFWVVEGGAGYEKTEVQQHMMRISFGEKGRQRVASNDNPDLNLLLSQVPSLYLGDLGANLAAVLALDTSATSEQSSWLSMLSQGDTETLKKAQEILNRDGFNFGPRTSSAIRLFQENQGIPVTGTIDQFTYDALFPNPKLQQE